MHVLLLLMLNVSNQRRKKKQCALQVDNWIEIIAKNEFYENALRVNELNSIHNWRNQSYFSILMEFNKAVEAQQTHKCSRIHDTLGELIETNRPKSLAHIFHLILIHFIHLFDLDQWAKIEYINRPFCACMSIHTSDWHILPRINAIGCCCWC